MQTNHAHPLSRRARRISAAVLAAAACGLAAAALGPVRAVAAQDAAQPAAAVRHARWQARLARLDPLRPIDYLELGEEVADSAQGDDDRELAQQLFGLAGALDPERLGRSAMLALAAFAKSPPERARAEAAAELVGGSGAARATMKIEPMQIDALSRSFSFYRRGDGRRALSALGQNNGEALLAEIGPRLPGGAQAYRDECAAMRKSGVAASGADMVRRQLELELALRRGEMRSVSLDLALHGDAPLVEIDLADPKSLWGVDPSRPWWRDGAWRGNG